MSLPSSFLTKSISTLFIFLILTSFLFPQEKNLFEEYITNYKNAKNVPSISAAVLKDGKIIWSGAAGYSDVENLVPATPKTVYRIASISKSITAVAIMQLVEKGKIKLDDDALKYIPYFPRKRWKFTIRQLLNHTSGIRNYKGIDEFNNKRYFNSIEDALGILKYDSLSFKPGTKQRYTTLGYNLLAAIIEHVTKNNFLEYLNENIFEPSKMPSTFPEIQSDIVLNRAHGYDKDKYRNLKNAPLADLSIKFPGGGIISTSEDLLKFAGNILNGKLIKHSTLDTMLVPTKLNNGKIINYGLGFSLPINKNENYFSHSGLGTGFTSLLIIFPKDSLATITLINARDRDLDSPALQLANIALGKNYQKPLKSISDELLRITLSQGIISAIYAYRLLKHDTTDNFLISANELRQFGSDLLTLKKINSAIKFYKILILDYPYDADIFLDLADAYYQDKNLGLALRNYRNVLRLEPSNPKAIKMIKELEQ